jgi:hypothetical protein
MNNNSRAIAGKTHIKFDSIRAVFQRSRKSGERVFRSDGRRAAVSDD